MPRKGFPFNLTSTSTNLTISRVLYRTIGQNETALKFQEAIDIIWVILNIITLFAGFFHIHLLTRDQVRRVHGAYIFLPAIAIFQQLTFIFSWGTVPQFLHCIFSNPHHLTITDYIFVPLVDPMNRITLWLITFMIVYLVLHLRFGKFIGKNIFDANFGRLTIAFVIFNVVVEWWLQWGKGEIFRVDMDYDCNDTLLTSDHGFIYVIHHKDNHHLRLFLFNIIPCLIILSSIITLIMTPRPILYSKVTKLIILYGFTMLISEIPTRAYEVFKWLIIPGNGDYLDFIDLEEYSFLLNLLATVIKFLPTLLTLSHVIICAHLSKIYGLVCNENILYYCCCRG